VLSRSHFVDGNSHEERKLQKFVSPQSYDILGEPPTGLRETHLFALDEIINLGMVAVLFGMPGSSTTTTVTLVASHLLHLNKEDCLQSTSIRL
jgi:hypothetical protein